MDLTIEVATEEEGRVMFDNLSQGGKVFMPFERMFWGTTFERLEDRFVFGGKSLPNRKSE